MLKGTLLSTAIDLVQISGSVVQNYGHLHHFAVGNCQLVEITSFAPLCGGIADMATNTAINPTGSAASGITKR